jgi:GntR family transcriptional regulator/MocR family aminotransferase
MTAMIFSLSRKKPKPLYEQIYDQLKQAIQGQRLTAGTRLSSIRQMAEDLQVSRTTVETAYQQLTVEGYLDNRPRSGYYVADIGDHLLSFLQQASSEAWMGTPEATRLTDDTDILYDFRNGGVDPDAFPWRQWRKTVDEVYQSERRDLLFCRERFGDRQLRAEIARYLFRTRGVRSHPDQIVLAAGTQHGLSLISMLLQSVTDTIGVENPGCANARQVFRWHGLNVTSIPVEKDGIQVDAVFKAGIKAVLVTPSHQFPSGVILSIQKRIQLLQWAQQQGGWIIEDDYDGEFCYHRQPIPALQGLDRCGRVIYIGSFTKCFIPTLRVAYMVLPATWHRQFVEGFSMYDQPTSRLHQQALLLFMKRGHFERHMRRMRTLYRRKHDWLIQHLTPSLPVVRVIGREAGLHLLLEMEPIRSEQEWLKRAERYGVKLYPTSHYWNDHLPGNAPVLLMDYGGVALEHFPDALERLQRAWT